eukprot:GHVU01077858.1.p1 GENE.GHVU01077858.1~~GHVU01077858.1.p1  ORF type:complete len:136 (+),score=5.58 GHVU01077858.1:30-410(+)
MAAAHPSPSAALSLTHSLSQSVTQSLTQSLSQCSHHQSGALHSIQTSHTQYRHCCHYYCHHYSHGHTRSMEDGRPVSLSACFVTGWMDASVLPPFSAYGPFAHHSHEESLTAATCLMLRVAACLPA